MAPRMGKVAARTRTATFEIEGDEWVVEYRPFSRDLLKEALRADKSDEERLDASIDLLSQVVRRWNLEDDEGNAKPFDADWLRAVGLDYVGLLLNGLYEDMSNPKGKPTNSAAG
jgi:hypothetical protein